MLGNPHRETDAELPGKTELALGPKKTEAAQAPKDAARHFADKKTTPSLLPDVVVGSRSGK